MNDRKSDFFRRGSDGFCSGRREMGGVPKVMQWMRLKQPVRMISSDLRSSHSMCAYSRVATAPPAE